MNRQTFQPKGNAEIHEDILSITRQVIDSSALWNRVALEMNAEGEMPPIDMPDLLPKNVLFSSNQELTTDQWNSLALEVAPKR
jgi:hypothetical protein